MQYLSVERLDNKKPGGRTTFLTDASSSSVTSDKASTTTNGSVMSVGPFSLPSVRSVTASSSDSSAVSEIKCSAPSAPNHTPRIKQTVTGVVELCNFMIDHFGKIKRQLSGDSEVASATPTTPVVGRKAAAAKKNLSKTAAASPDVPNASDITPTSKGKRGNKRAASVLSDTEEEPTPKKVRRI